MLFENLSLATLDNPIILAFIVAILRSVLGYVGNRLENSKTEFDIGKLGATLAWYETFLVILSQSPYLGSQGALVITVILDVVRTAIKALKE